MGRTPVLSTFRTGDEVQDRNFDHIKQTLNPVLRNPLFQSQDFRWMEIAATSATGTPTFALQYRTQETWATILTLTSAGQIVQPTWTAPAFLNSWAQFGSGSATVGFFKDANGVVHLRGAVSGGTVGLSAFTLPSGYRPSAGFLRFAVPSNDLFGKVDITSAGDVKPTAPSSNVYVSLEGISFDTR